MIEAARKRRGEKRREFAERLGLSYNHIYGLERGWNTASEETLQRIADALELDLDAIAIRETDGEADAGTEATRPSAAASSQQAANQDGRERVA